MKRIYTQAPLPFHGQKRRWNGQFKSALQEFGECNIFVDIFGGSGLLSRMAKDERPDARVIYNDYDGYTQRLLNIPRTNALLSDLRGLLHNYPDNTLIREPLRSAIIDRIRKEDKCHGYVDFITLSSSLLFSMNYATTMEEMEKTSLYNTIRQSDYCADGYLDGIEPVKQDYRELFNLWRHLPNVCFLIDPPYLSTEVGTYTGYWKLKDYLDVIHTLKDTNYFYFTSNKSNIVELCEWLEHNYATANPFHGATQKTIRSHMNHNAHYTDIMFFKRRSL